MFKKFGSEVAIFFRSELPLSGFDIDIRKRAAQNLTEMGIDLYPKTKFKRIEKSTNSFKLYVGDQCFSFTKILNALGRNSKYP